MTVLTATQTQLAAAKTDKAKVALLITTLLESGATVKEVLQLKGKHIGEAVLQLPDRQVTISKTLSQKLSQENPSEYVFASREGASLTPRRAQQQIKQAFEKIGITGTATDIRYAHISHAISVGISVEAISTQTGLSKSRVAALAKQLPEKQARQTLNETEQKQLLKNTKEKDAALLRTLLEAGLKVGELVKLKGKDLKNTSLRVGKGKIELSPQLAVDLHNIGALNNQPLFVGRGANALSARAVQKKVKTYLQQFDKLDQHKPQVLRETAIINDLKEGVNAEKISRKFAITQERLGQIISKQAGNHGYERWTL